VVTKLIATSYGKADSKSSHLRSLNGESTQNIDTALSGTSLISFCTAVELAIESAPYAHCVIITNGTITGQK
jgi:hypothetical protein